MGYLQLDYENWIDYLHNYDPTWLLTTQLRTSDYEFDYEFERIMNLT